MIILCLIIVGFCIFVGVGNGEEIGGTIGAVIGGIVGGIAGIALSFLLFIIQGFFTTKNGSEHEKTEKRSNELAASGKVCPLCGSKIREIITEYHGTDYSCTECKWRTW